MWSQVATLRVPVASFRPATRGTQRTTSATRRTLEHREWRRRSRSTTTTPRAAGEKGGGTDDNGRMHVPTDAFGGMSPEYKAASALKNLFTMVAVRVVLAQEQGYDNEGGGMTETYRGLQDYLAANPLRDGNKWLEQLMRHEDNNMRLTALRLLEVRKAYASGQFDFKDMHELAVEVGLRHRTQTVHRAWGWQLISPPPPSSQTVLKCLSRKTCKAPLNSPSPPRCRLRC